MTRKPSPFNSNHIFVDTNVLAVRINRCAESLMLLLSLLLSIAPFMR